MKTGNSRKMAALLSTAFMLGATGVTAFASNVTGLSVNTEFPPLTCRKETIPENSDFFRDRFLCRIVSFFLSLVF